MITPFGRLKAKSLIQKHTGTRKSAVKYAAEKAGILMETSQIEEQFSDIAGQYDEQRRAFIPCYDAFYGWSTEFLAGCVGVPRRILDLGAGTGLLAQFWLQYFPEAQYVLVDVSEDMLDVSRARFAGQSNFAYTVMDYSKELPDGEFDLIISALSIHHLTEPGKRNLFARVKDRLPEGGVFANYDQFCGTTPLMTRWLDAWWQEKLDQSSLTPEDLRKWRKRRMLDRECSLLAEMQMLQMSGFDAVQCVFSFDKFSVICAVV